MKENIIKTKMEHPEWGYRKIAQHLQIPKSTVVYHLSPTAKLQSKERTRKYRKENLNTILHRKKDNFQCIGPRRKSGKYRVVSTFSAKELRVKLLASPFCYLTGEKINLLLPKTYQLDHIHPVSKGGNNSLNNCGLTTKQANLAKSDSTVSEFLELCKKVLIYNGYVITKLEEGTGIEPDSV
jgi:5-methylcytosine-specific restriction endonuclease McrA